MVLPTQNSLFFPLGTHWPFFYRDLPHGWPQCLSVSSVGPLLPRVWHGSGIELNKWMMLSVISEGVNKWMDGSCSLNVVLELDIFMSPPLYSVVKLNSYFFRRLQGPRLAGSWDVRRFKFVKAVRYTTFPRGPSTRRVCSEATWADMICPCVSRKPKHSLGWNTKILSKNKDWIVNTKDWGLKWEGGTIERRKQRARAVYLLSETKSFQCVPN